MNIERLPPQAVEVEQAILGACLIQRSAIGRAAAILCSDEVFYHSPHGLIWNAILALEAKGEAVDQLTVVEELKRRGQLDAVGGVAYISELGMGVASAANVEHHAKIVAGKHLLRRVIEVGVEMTRQGYEATQEAEAIVMSASEQLYRLLELGHRPGGYVPIERVMHETLEAAQAAQGHAGLTGVDTGLVDLNQITGGWQNGDLVIIAARPSVGKSALATGMGLHAAVKSDVGVAIVSLEMANLQVGQRLLAAASGVNLHRLRTGTMGAEAWTQIAHASTTIAAAPIWVDDAPGQSVIEMATRARQLKQRHGIGLVIVDYLQLATATDGQRNISREQEVSRISRGLKGMAKELNVPVLALSQLSRASEARADHRPQLSDLRDSGQIEADADVVVFLYRPEMQGKKDQPGRVELLVRKQRNGPTGDVVAHFDAETATFSNAAPDYRSAQGPSLQDGRNW